MRESKLYSEDQLKAFVDIDETICFYEDKRIYELAIPNIDNINKINKLKKEGWHITYYTARGGASKIDYAHRISAHQLRRAVAIGHVGCISEIQHALGRHGLRNGMQC